MMRNEKKTMNFVSARGGKQHQRDIATTTVHQMIAELLPRFRTLDIEVVFRTFKKDEGADNQTPRMKKETMFIQMLEGLHHSEAEVVCHAKDKVLHQKYKGLSDNVVKTAFGWNDDYVRLDSVQK